MKLSIDGHRLVLTAEPGDARTPNESALLYQLKLKLQSLGLDVIKKPMWKDGHLVSDYCRYIRDRREKFAIWDDLYAIRDAAKDYRKQGTVSLSIEGDIPSQLGDHYEP